MLEQRAPVAPVGSETMAGRRKGEGIALLSVYADEDEEDVDMDDEDEAMPDASSPGPEPSGSTLNAGSPGQRRDGQGAEAPAAPSVTKLRQGGARSLGIVDYAQDEAAMSPEAEYPEEAQGLEPGIVHHQVEAENGVHEEKSPSAGGMVAELAAEPGPDQATAGGSPGGLGAESPSPEVGLGSNGNAASEALELALEAFDDFLPAPPTEKCSEDLQLKFAKYLALKNSGRSFNEVLRHSKGYRNPDFLQRAVRHQEIDQIGSCFRKEVFDPHGYDPGDYYDAITAELKKEMERKEQERKQSLRIDFVRSSVGSAVAPGMPDPRSKPIMQLITGHRGLVAATSAAQASFIGLRAAGASGVPGANGEAQAPAVKADGRSKRSKWDKVEQDSRSSASAPPPAKDVLDGSFVGHGSSWRNRHAAGR